MNILFYISGHGYGHATRMRAIMDALIVLDPKVHFYVKTTAPLNFFADIPEAIVTLHPLAIDTGIVEKGILNQDELATLSQYAEIQNRRTTIIAKELAFIKENAIAVIVSDIPPLASEIGAAAQVPVIACSNFSWDFNYIPYAKQHPQYAHLIKDIQSSYEKTSLLLKLPFHHEFNCFPKQQDIPLVARHPTAEINETKTKLGLETSDSRPIVLVTFRSDNPVFRQAITDLARTDDVIILTYGSTAEKNINKVIAVGKEWRPWQFPDLLHVSSVVVSKIGYSLLAECIAAGTRLVYPPRENYPEFELLHAGAQGNLPSLLMPQNDFLDGHWQPYIQQCLSDNKTYPSRSTHGAEVAANIIYQYAKPSK